MLSRRFASAVPLQRRLLSTHAQGVFQRLGLSPDPTSSETPGVYHGSWGGRGALVDSINPANGELLARVRQASAEDTEDTLVAAREAYKQWRTVPAPRRGLVLQDIGRALEEKRDDLGAVVSLEMGKIKSEGRGEVQEIIDIVGYAVGLSRSIGGSVFPSERPNHFITEVANPLGVVGVISAFNFPTAVYGWNLSLSLVNGNATIWKPAPTTSLCAIATTKIIASVLESHKLPGALSALVCGGGEVGQALVDDKRVDLLSFTGSEARGKIVGQQVQARFGKSLLELGGNNAAIVLPDANMALALPSIAFAALGTAGQRCTTTRRLFLHSSIADSFLASLVAAYKSTASRIGDPLAEGTLIGPVHAQDGVNRYLAAIEQIKKDGGEILVGGKRAEVDAALSKGNWVEPTIVKVANGGRGFKMMQEETFAPILYVSTFETLEEAIELNNGVAQGLSSALFTQDLSNALKWIGPEGSDTGIVNVNGSTSGAEIGAPFGGNKSTGWGRESGGDAWKQYARWASCTLNWSNEVALAQGVNFSVEE
ncbi:succinate-semialdehyde dehydrogenase [Leucosporidium creatinivorum]|uniref:aldehyde dehydrogenase (NAD(+)) n=1 Tax=Leucosporidium creatinivorum TaxID=106004 RepID=A0A1Y2ELJ1_9BASI|nr:succinate-semialdehyde dehydrogenase [Leucosporidium creatinivorum]